jgi:hypothetical protein
MAGSKIESDDFKGIDKNTELKNQDGIGELLQQKNDDLVMISRLKLLNLIVEIVVQTTLKEYYETSD